MGLWQNPPRHATWGDKCLRIQIRTGNAAQSIAVLRHMALNLLKQGQSTKRSIRAKRLKAGWVVPRDLPPSVARTAAAARGQTRVRLNWLTFELQELAERSRRRQ